ncbi:MAG: hypothetical protein JHD07_08285, partial [Bradyrhizobium sp.]|nr:hypothetical protein [Bradyrhizobium sp.]
MSATASGRCSAPSGTAGLLAHSRRRIVQTNLALCFPELSQAQRTQVARRTFVCFAQTFLDRSWLWHAPPALLQKRLH